MPSFISRLLITAALMLFTCLSFSQEAGTEDLTVVYDIRIKSTKGNMGIEETYNGGIQTLMIKAGKARMRMVSLMRTQSIYFWSAGNNVQQVVIAKESGQDKYKYKLNASQWKLYNSRYDDAQYSFDPSSITVMGYHCKKATITLKDGRKVIAYYTTALQQPKYIEPMFAGIPGMVLQYEYAGKKGSITYVASKISHNNIDEEIFKEPGAAFASKTYVPTK